MIYFLGVKHYNNLLDLSFDRKGMEPLKVKANYLLLYMVLRSSLLLSHIQIPSLSKMEVVFSTVED